MKKFLRFVFNIAFYPLTYINFFKLKEKAQKSSFFYKIYMNRCKREHCLIFPDQYWKSKPIFVHGLNGININNSSKIGKNVKIFQMVQIVNSGIEWDKCAVIGDNVVIGACAIIIGDISIGDNVVIGAGSVVTKSIPDNTMVVGNPAHPIKKYNLSKNTWEKI